MQLHHAHIANAPIRAQYSQNTQNSPWENIVPLNDVGTLPCLALKHTPEILRDYALECASHYQTAFEMPLFCALACLATAVQGKYQVELKQGYIEPLNLYILITSEPSELKSPTLKRLKRPQSIPVRCLIDKISRTI